MLTGIFGGLVSSTLVTLDLSRLAQQFPGMRNAVAAGILVACATMFLRILLLTFIINAPLSETLLPPMVACFAVTIVAAFLFWRFADDLPSGTEIKLQNPFQLGVALKFGALLAVVMLLTRVLKAYFGDMGTYFLAAVSGIADVDAITLSVAHAVKSQAEIGGAGYAILVATMVNSCFKSSLSWLIGDRGLGMRITGVTALSIVAAAVTLVWS
jgi:uncharacterized membrane protein (DUF4010 family)